MKKIMLVCVLVALVCCAAVVKKHVDDLRESEAMCRYEREAEQADDTAFKQAASTFKIAELEKYLKDFPAGKNCRVGKISEGFSGRKACRGCYGEDPRA